MTISLLLYHVRLAGGFELGRRRRRRRKRGTDIQVNKAEVVLPV